PKAQCGCSDRHAYVIVYKRRQYRQSIHRSTSRSRARLDATPFFFPSRRRHTRSVSAFLLNRSSDLSIVIGSKHITLNATGGGFLTASKQFRHGATSKSRSNTASNSTKHKSPHLSGWRQIISLIT